MTDLECGACRRPVNQPSNCQHCGSLEIYQLKFEHHCANQECWKLIPLEDVERVQRGEWPKDFICKCGWSSWCGLEIGRTLVSTT
jgi:hypothetical protein